MASVMVRLSGVGKKYPPNRYVLRQISFDLKKGEFAYVTGISGAGKTTLLNLLFAVEKPTEGCIFVNNRDVESLPRAKICQFRREVGFVFQDFKLLPDLSIFQNVSMPLDIRRMSTKDVERRVNGILSLVGLEDRVKDYPMCLSGGEQQRIAIARSIVGKPPILLADEPTGNLDAQTARDIMALFKEIHQMGTTVLIATHDESLIESYPSRVIRIEKGVMTSDERMDG